MTPLPSWITDKGDGRYSVDIEAAKAAGESIPIQLGNIPQFADFFTDPPTRRGAIEFVQHFENKPIDPFIEWLDEQIKREDKLSSDMVFGYSSKSPAFKAAKEKYIQLTDNK